MKFLILFISLLFSSLVLTFAQTGPSIDEINKAETAYLEAIWKKDKPTIERLVSPYAVFILGHGRQSRTDIEDLGSPSHAVDNAEIKQWGKMSLLTYSYSFEPEHVVWASSLWLDLGDRVLLTFHEESKAVPKAVAVEINPIFGEPMSSDPLTKEFVSRSNQFLFAPQTLSTSTKPALAAGIDKLTEAGRGKGYLLSASGLLSGLKSSHELEDVHFFGSSAVVSYKLLWTNDSKPQPAEWVTVIYKQNGADWKAVFAQTSVDESSSPKITTSKTNTGLVYADLVVGTGASPAVGQTVSVQYTGWLLNGSKFDSSRDRGAPFDFVLGRGQVIKGWDEGVVTMKVGGRRRLLIPANLAYGTNGSGNLIPPNSTLIFDIELLAIKDVAAK